MNRHMRVEEYRKGDIVVIFSYFDKNKDYYNNNGIKTYGIDEAYRHVPDLQKNVWDNLLHCNKVVMKEIADKVFRILQNANVFRACCSVTGSSNSICYNKTVKFGIERTVFDIPEGLNEWLQKVSVHKTKSTHAGCIVMNCNPFTKGHRYLIEYASKQVDTLYIVVEEDKSFFKFKDRLEMVSMGTSDLQNVVVIPSGKYVISTVTLPGYFNKEDATSAEFDATDDLGLFGDFIAKEFNITVRFAGEELNDIFTRHYNQEMAKILPQYGIRFCEIRRKEIGGQVISATDVRKYIKQKNWYEVRKLMLPQVYEYLYKHYFSVV